MSSELDIELIFATIPEDFCPESFQDILEALSRFSQFRLSSSGQTTLVNFGATEPDFNNRNKPWHRTTIDGKPLGTYVFFNGRWVKEYPYEPGQYVEFSGARVDLDKLGPFAFADGTNGTTNRVSEMDPANDTADNYDKAIYMYTGYDA